MPTTRTDPLRNFKFEVTFHPLSSELTTGAPGSATSNLSSFAAGLGSVGFAAMSGLAVRNEVIPYREGGMNTHPHKMVGQTDFDPITLSRGVIENQDQLWKWQRFIHNWQNGAEGSTGGQDYRCDIVVRVFDHPHSNATYNNTTTPNDAAPVLGNPKLGIKIFNCWPAAYATGGLNAGDNSIIIQEMTLHNEGWYLEFDTAKIADLPSYR
jgi:phage tail-like protein